MPPITTYSEHGARFTYMRRFKEDGVELRNLMGINRVVAGRASAPTEPHSHDLLEIHHVARGTQYQVVDGTPYRMRAGDMLVTRPGESHYSGTVQEKRIDYYLGIDMRGEKNHFLGFHGEPGENLRRRIEKIPRFFSTDNSLHVHLDEILAVYASEEPHKALLIHALLAQFFVKLLGFSEKSLERNVSPGVKAAILYVRKNLTKPLSVADLAYQAGLAASAFRERFSKEVGQSPKEYILRERMEAAMAHLREGKRSVTDIAHELQFSSSQHFAKMFRKIFNRTPGEYAAAARGAQKR